MSTEPRIAVGQSTKNRGAEILRRLTHGSCGSVDKERSPVFEGSVRHLGHVEAVPVEVTEGEHQRRGVPVEQVADFESEAGDRGVRGAGIGRSEPDARVEAARQVVATRDQRDRRVSSGKRQLDPAEPGLQLHVEPLRQAKVQQQCLGAILVRHRDGDVEHAGERLGGHARRRSRGPELIADSGAGAPELHQYWRRCAMR